MSKKLISLFLVAVLSLGVVCGLASCSDTDDEIKEVTVLDEVSLGEKFTVSSDFKIGFILLHDEQSTYDLNFINAAKKIQTYLSLTDDQVLFEKNIPEEGNDCYEAAERLKNKGCKIVFADSFGHEANMIKAAQAFPDVQFCHATGTKAGLDEYASLTNYHNAFASIYEGRYLAGIAAGMKLNEMISSGKITAEQAIIGYVGAFPYAEVVSGYTSFFLGARSVCPTATMKVRYTSSWYDYDREKQTAETLIDTDKCVLISQHADSMGAPTACNNKKVPNVSYNGSTIKACNKSFIISSAIDWSPYFYHIIKAVTDGTAIEKNWCGTLSTGSVVLSKMNEKVAAEGTVAKIEEAVTKLKNGTLKVFDVTKFTYDNGKTVDADFLADVIDLGDYKADTKVVKTENGITYFAESEFRSAPYFEIRIDGITELNKGWE